MGQVCGIIESSDYAGVQEAARRAKVSAPIKVVKQGKVGAGMYVAVLMGDPAAMKLAVEAGRTVGDEGLTTITACLFNPDRRCARLFTRMVDKVPQVTTQAPQSTGDGSRRDSTGGWLRLRLWPRK